MLAECSSHSDDKVPSAAGSRGAAQGGELPSPALHHAESTLPGNTKEGAEGRFLAGFASFASAATEFAGTKRSGEAQRVLWTCDLGCGDYEEVRGWQERLVARRRAGEIPDVLLLCSHPPVVTAGRATTPEELAAVRPALEAAGLPLRPCERGGRLTYHDPGQVVAYPIMRLSGPDRDLHAYQRRLEAVVLATLARFGVEGERRPGQPGVWVGEAKIASVGIAVRGWVTWHGLALNVSGDLGPFRLFSPCGIKGLVVTSLAETLGRELARAEVEEALVAAFVAEFGCERKAVSPQELCQGGLPAGTPPF